MLRDFIGLNFVKKRVFLSVTQINLIFQKTIFGNKTKKFSITKNTQQAEKVWLNFVFIKIKKNNEF